MQKTICLYILFLLFLLIPGAVLGDPLVVGDGDDSHAYDQACSLGTLRTCDAWCTAPGAWCNASNWTSSCPGGTWYDNNPSEVPVDCCTNADCSNRCVNTFGSSWRYDVAICSSYNCTYVPTYCGGETPYCNTVYGCVQCTNNNHCPDDYCQGSNLMSYQCNITTCFPFVSKSCSGNTPICSESAGNCVQCLTNEDCNIINGGLDPYCISGTCEECSSDPHCGTDYCNGDDWHDLSCSDNSCDENIYYCSHCLYPYGCVDCTNSSHCPADTCISRNYRNYYCSGTYDCEYTDTSVECCIDSDCDDSDPATVDTCVISNHTCSHSMAETDCGLRGYDGAQTVSFACDPSGTLNSALRVQAADNNAYSIILVDPSDANASSFHVYTSEGVKALKIF